MFLFVFDIFKIGVGPSSSHTMGPTTAGARFLDEMKNGQWPRPRNATVSRIRVTLHGSLAFIGIGHATDRAVVRGLCGYVPATVYPDAMEEIVAAVGSSLPAILPISSLLMTWSSIQKPLPGHANGMVFEGLDADGVVLIRRP